MKITEMKKSALSALKPNWGKAILVILIIFLFESITPFMEISYFGSFERWWEMRNNYIDYPVYIILAEIALGILLMPLSVGCYWYFLEVSKRNKPEINELFTPYKEIDVFWKMIGATIVQAIFIFFWSLLLIIPGIIKAISYSQTFYILKDHPEMGILEAITESRKRMDGLKGDFFLLVLSFIGWAILSALTFRVVDIFLLPYFYTTLGVFYQRYISKKSTYYQIKNLPKTEVL